MIIYWRLRLQMTIQEQISSYTYSKIIQIIKTLQIIFVTSTKIIMFSAYISVVKEGYFEIISSRQDR